MGCLWGSCESSIPYCFYLCFELESWTFLVCESLGIYHIHLSKHPWKASLSNCSWQPYWKGCVWLWVEGTHDSNEMPNSLRFFCLLFLFYILGVLVLMIGLRFKNIYMENIHFKLRFKNIQNAYFPLLEFWQHFENVIYK
jgi:hypothetical protein